MAKPPLRNVGASVRQRLLNLSRTEWAVYIEDLGLAGLELGEVTAGLALFLLPHAERARGLAANSA
jgi:hypothetical protein